MASEATMLTLMVALATFAAVIYIMLGRRLGRRRVGAGASLANHAWQSWWILLAASTLLGTVLTGVLGALDLYELPLAMTISVVNLSLVFGALWGLSYYLAYVVTGRERLWLPLAWFWGLSAIGWLYTIFAARPVGTQVEAGSASVLYAEALESQPLYGLLLGGLLVPIIAVAMAYAYLGFKADDRTVRFRIILVSFSLIIWFGISLVATTTPLADLAAWPLISRLMSLGAAALIYVAHFPPRVMIQRFKLRPIIAE